VKTHENMKNRKPFRAFQRSGKTRHLDGAQPWHGPKSPGKASAGSKKR